MKYLKQIFTGIILLIIINNSYSQYSAEGGQASWYWQQPYPSGNQLNAVDFADSQTGYSVGNLGTILKTTNGGEVWNVLNVNTKAQLLDVKFINQNTGFAVGDSGIILRTINGGENWTRISSPATTFLHEVCFPTPNTGYIVGLDGVIIKTTNGGLNWFSQVSGTGAVLFSVSFIDSLNGCVGGRQTILRTTNGGVNWIFQSIGGTFEGFVSMCYMTNQIIYTLTDDKGFYKSTNAGLNWSGILIINILEDLARSMIFKDLNTGYAVTDFGRLFTTTNG